jgi:hypothetical protein
MTQTLASASYFEFFTGDFIVFGFLGFVIWCFLKKKDDEFYDK